MFDKAKELGIIVINNLESLTNSSLPRLLFEKRSQAKDCYIVFPHEWHNRSKQILCHIKSYNNKDTISIHGRKCEVKQISLKELKQFCELHHIQGSNRLGLAAWGLFHEEELVGVMSLGRHPRQNADNDCLLLDRLCFKHDVKVHGGSSKLFSAARKWAAEKGIKKIVSFSDNRWSLGNVYEKMGFTLDKELSPDYFYVDKNNYTTIYSKQSQKKSATNCPEDMTELQWTKLRGLLRVYDAGKKRWIHTVRLDRHIKSFKHRAHGYYQTKKAGIIYYQSSYELRTATLLDDMNEVSFYTNQVEFSNKNGKKRYIDFLVTWADDTHSIIEVKPKRRVPVCKNQIDDNRWYATKNGYGFSLWTENDLGHYAKIWADGFLSKITPVDYTEERKKKCCKKSMTYYEKHIKEDKVQVWCNYCNVYHNPLRLTYERNINDHNGEYICEPKGGHIAGSKPKPSLRKDNPYAAEGKKQCTNIKCKQKILPFECFGPDKSRRDGYSSQCKECRAKFYREKYQKLKDKK